MRIEEAIGIGAKPQVEVGTKCTIHYYSDAHPAEVVKVSKSGNTVWIRRNVVIADPNSTGGMGHQDWLFKEGDFLKRYGELAEEVDDWSFFKVTKRKNGTWRTSGSNLYVSMNQWHEYHDWSF